MNKTINIYYDFVPNIGIMSYVEVEKAIEENLEIINTCCLSFFHIKSLNEGYEVVIHDLNGNTIILSELFKIQGKYTNRKIKEGHNVYKMFIAGEFNWQNN